MDRDAAVEVAVDCRSLLGEGVTWDADSDTLLWLDVDGCVLHRLAAGSRHTSTPLERTTSVVVPRRGGGFIAVAGREVMALDDRGAFGDVIATLPAEGDGRANDGRVDPHGRLWVGTVDRSGANRAGLFCVDESGAVDADPVRTGAVQRHRLEPRRSTLLPRRLAAAPHRGAGAGRAGLPDGRRGVRDVLGDARRPDRRRGRRGVGRPLGRRRAPAIRSRWTVRSCAAGGRGVDHQFAFGGADLRTLYITSANSDLDADTHRRMPHAGSLFAAEPGVGGRGYTPFGSAAP